MKYAFASLMKDDIAGFLLHKHSLGYPYVESERILYCFDKFCLDKYPHETTITETLGNDWAVIKETESTKSFQNRISPIRELAKYINRNGKYAYVINIDFLPRDYNKYHPHIFTYSELDKFFEVADTLSFNDRSRLRHLQIPVIFRLMYCLGLRPNEARLIKCEHINLDTGELFIPKSKGYTDRSVFLPPDLLEICKNYYIYLQKEFPNSINFFPCQRFKGNPYTKSWIIKNFRTCWLKTGITLFAGNPPRPYDFRHSFATHKLYSWMKENQDIGSLLPYLSAFMGHADFSHTAYYIHLIPESFSEISKMDMALYEHLIPEVPSNED